MHTLKIAEVFSKGVGEYQCVQSFVPPMLTARYFLDRLKEMTELIKAKARLFQGKHEEEAFIRTLAVLQHWCVYPDVHPEQVYLLLVQLCGFGRFVKYEHNNLNKTFSELGKEIQRRLDGLLPAEITFLELEEKEVGLYEAKLGDGELFLRVSFDSTDFNWSRRFKRHTKISANKYIDRLISSALPGLQLNPVKTSLLLKEGTVLFRLSEDGEIWKEIEEEKTLSIYVSEEFSDVKLELIQVKE